MAEDDDRPTAGGQSDGSQRETQQTNQNNSSNPFNALYGQSADVNNSNAAAGAADGTSANGGSVADGAQSLSSDAGQKTNPADSTDSTQSMNAADSLRSGDHAGQANQPQSEPTQTGQAQQAGQGSENVAARGDFTANPYVGNGQDNQPTQPMQPQYGQYAQQPQYGQYAQPQYGQYATNAGGQGGQYGGNAQYAQPTNQYGQPQSAGEYGQPVGSYGSDGAATGDGGDNAGTDSQPTTQYDQGFAEGAGASGAPTQTMPGQPGAVPPYGSGAGNGMNGFNGGNSNGAGKAKSRNGNNNVLVAVVSAVLTAILCLGVGYVGLVNGWVPIHDSSSMSGITSNSSGGGSAKVKGGAAPDWTSVSKSVSNSVVSIQTRIQGGEAKGSGAILDTDGHVVTNNHVISGATQIQVTLANGQMYEAKVTGTDATTDLAVIQLQNAPKDLTPVKFADSDKLAVGENIMAVGNPLGYDNTSTTGIVSALNRPVSVMDDSNSEIVTNAVQIDAAINPGNSGGPTFNAAGQVIGINSSIATASSSSQSQSGSIGIGFAIPSDLVKRVADEIVKDGSVKHVMLGITIKSATATADGVTRSGAQITKGSDGTAVSSGSPAAKAGLKEGDTIVAFNGNAVGSNAALLGYVRAAGLGDKVALSVVRGGKTMNVNVTLDQEEKQVTGSNRQEQKNNGNSDGNGSGNGNGDGGGNSDGNGDGDDGGLWDPFGFF